LPYTGRIYFVASLLVRASARTRANFTANKSTEKPTSAVVSKKVAPCALKHIHIAFFQATLQWPGRCFALFTQACDVEIKANSTSTTSFDVSSVSRK